MLYNIKNEFLTATINSVGAELWGIQTLGQDPVSCLWDGNKSCGLDGRRSVFLGAGK